MMFYRSILGFRIKHGLGVRYFTIAPPNPFGQSETSDDLVPRGLLKYSVASPILFYFGGTKRCKLCGELCLEGENAHMATARHNCREVFVDLLVPLMIKRTIEPNLFLLYAEHLLKKRTQSIVSPIEKSVSQKGAGFFDKRLERHSKALCLLRQLGILRFSSMIPLTTPSQTTRGSESPASSQAGGSRGLAFERLEHIGDSQWSAPIASRIASIFWHTQWVSSESDSSESFSASHFQALRDFAESTENLERMFDLLNLRSLFLSGTAFSESASSKFKADVLESIVGELSIFIWSFAPRVHNVEQIPVAHQTAFDFVLPFVKETLEELFDLVVLCMLELLAGNALKIAPEMVALSVKSEMIPRLNSIRKSYPVSWRMMHVTRIVHHYPQGPLLSSEAEEMKKSACLHQSVYWKLFTIEPSGCLTLPKLGNEWQANSQSEVKKEPTIDSSPYALQDRKR